MEDLVISGGLADFFKVEFDHKKFLGHPKFKEGVHSIGIAAKDSAKAPLDFDDRVIDATVSAIDAILDQYKNSGPLVVGASGESVVMLKKHRTKEEAEQLLRDAGADPAKFSPFIILLIQLLPSVIAAIKYIRELLGK